eukprot:Gb_03071 [translate_table: standard]
MTSNTRSCGSGISRSENAGDVAHPRRAVRKLDWCKVLGSDMHKTWDRSHGWMQWYIRHSAGAFERLLQRSHLREICPLSNFDGLGARVACELHLIAPETFQLGPLSARNEFSVAHLTKYENRAVCCPKSTMVTFNPSHHYIEGVEFINAILDVVRKDVESCDCMQGSDNLSFNIDIEGSYVANTTQKVAPYSWLNVDGTFSQLQGATFCINKTYQHIIMQMPPFDILCISTLLVHGVPLNRRSFPPNFIFGTSSSSYQYEGAASEGGRMPSIWDTFAHIPGNVIDGSNGDVAVDQYHLYPADVEAMAKMGMDAYRFSISWSRLIPKGRGEINPEGIAHYNNFISKLLQHGIKPFVTLTHFDIPQVLQDEYGGWLSPQIVNDFADYAEVCFEAFGDRVKHWITLNEPNLYALLGYDGGIYPPARCSASIGNCSAGDSTIEPYIAAHYQLLSHVAAVERYQKFKRKQNGSIGLAISAQWYEPLRNTTRDQAAVERILDFTVAWVLDPLYFGKYPSSMEKIVNSRLPTFTLEESNRLKGTLDFIGINHYTTNYVFDIPRSPTPTRYLDDIAAQRTGYRDGVLIGPKGPLQTYIEMDFDVPRGMAEEYNLSTPMETALNDRERVKYHDGYLEQLLLAIRGGANVEGYFVWTLMDDFEFRRGFTTKYGLHYVDFKDGLRRYPKASALWFNNFLTLNNNEDDGHHKNIYHSNVK